MRNWRVVRILGVMSVLSLFLLWNCSGLLDSQPDSSLQVKIATTENFQPGIAQSLGKVVAGQQAVTDSLGLISTGMVSFTPSSFVVELQELVLYTEYVETPSGEWVGGYEGAGKQINIELNREVDLINQGSLEALIQESVSIDSAKFGDYVGINMEIGDSATVSGELDLNNRTYTFTDLRVPMGWGSFNSLIPDHLAIADTTAPTIQVLIDAENAFQLENSEENTTDVAIDTSGTNIDFKSVIIFPYAGTDAPTVEKYRITWGSATELKYYIEVVALLDPDGTLMNVGWRNIYTNGFSLNAAYGHHIQPAYIWAAGISQNEDGSYAIVDHYTSSDVLDRVTSFPAFSLGEHSGTFTYGTGDNAMEVSYSAVKMTE